MRRDMDLVRGILLVMEQSRQSVDASVMVDSSHDFETVAYHLDIMQQAGLIKATLRGSNSRDYVQASADQITWQGQEFLSTVRDEDVWSYVKREVAMRVADAPLSLLTSLAARALSHALGLT